MRPLVQQLSLSTMPFHVFDSLSDPEVPPHDNAHEYVGWQNVRHLAKINAAEKASIIASQKELGLPLSKFG